MKTTDQYEKEFLDVVDKNGIRTGIVKSRRQVQKEKGWDIQTALKRKAAADIIVGDVASDELSGRLIEAVRIAPSAVNRQPWLIEKTDDKYYFYLKKSSNPLDFIIGDMRNIDFGIAIAHLFVSAKAEGFNTEFNFVGNDNGKHKFIAGVRVWK
ncbi:MAG: hypothetical protein FWE13_05420 [Firmicutes bacterium]|nr:hypothetical protein [Bacillota bacterium]